MLRHVRQLFRDRVGVRRVQRLSHPSHHPLQSIRVRARPLEPHHRTHLSLVSSSSLPLPRLARERVPAHSRRRVRVRLRRRRAREHPGRVAPVLLDRLGRRARTATAAAVTTTAVSRARARDASPSRRRRARRPGRRRTPQRAGRRERSRGEGHGCVDRRRAWRRCADGVDARGVR